MKYAIVNGIKIEAFTRGKGHCLCCNAPTLAKCGRVNIHHWAHISKKHCDPWWENETEWHRKWKSNFPQEWQEFVCFDEMTGEKHIADVKTNSGLVIEFQNSPISTEELNSRESFYKKMIWVINADKFRDNFSIGSRLPAPRSSLAQSIRIRKTGGNPIFNWISESNVFDSMVEIYSLSKIDEQVNLAYSGHHLYEWRKPRSVWLQANCEVYLDFGGENLHRLLVFDGFGLKCVQKILKANFIDRVCAGKYEPHY